MFRPFVLGAVTILLGAAPATAQDVAGGADHAVLTRYPGSVITWYDTKEFAPYQIATGPVTSYRHIDKWVTAEGKTTRINYELRGTRSFYEVLTNYRDALRRAGFTFLAEGSTQGRTPGNAIGERNFLDVHYRANEIAPGTSTLLNGSATTGGSGYLAAVLDRGEGKAHVVLTVTQQAADRVVVLVDVIEARPMDRGLITAQAIGEGIDRDGKVALYGIHFDVDKSVILPASQPALAEIAALLRARPTLRVYVVGHTDITGDAAHNQQLSEARAHAVVTALATTHRIAAARLEARGAGPYSPVATNRTDTGRALNRRVELVERTTP